MTKILHVTECLNGGVFEAITSTIQSASDFEHELLYQIRKNEPKPEMSNFINKGITCFHWDSKFYNRGLQLNSIVKERKPDIVHLHSSWAGFFGRYRKINSKIVYSSHGFAFQKKDSMKITRILFFCIELFCKRNTTANIAYMPYEYYLFTKKLRAKNSFFVESKLTDLSLERISSSAVQDNNDSNKKLIASVGRLTSAKDPIYFIKFCKNLRELGYKGEFCWIGDGDHNYKELLNINKILVTGWLDKSDLTEVINRVSLVALTSAWDSGPATLFEIVNLGVPVVLRDFPAAKYTKLETSKNSFKMARAAVVLLNMNRTEASLFQKSRLSETLEKLPKQTLNATYEEIQKL
jgi:glycosyltransferase involved in cell wall biosynthesis